MHEPVLRALTEHREVAMPAKPNAKRIGINAKRAAIAKAYGCPPDTEMVEYFYSRRHLAKVDRPNKYGWRELRLTEDYIDLAEAISETLRRIRDRDGMRYATEAARFLVDQIEWDIGRRDSTKAIAA
jgi:hypothetical protein